MRFLDKEGQLKDNKDGFSIIRNFYDENFNKSGEKYYKSDESEVKLRD